MYLRLVFGEHWNTLSFYSVNLLLFVYETLVQAYVDLFCNYDSYVVPLVASYF